VSQSTGHQSRVFIERKRKCAGTCIEHVSVMHAYECFIIAWSGDESAEQSETCHFDHVNGINLLIVLGFTRKLPHEPQAFRGS
jgi:hypothetical protein